MNDTASKTFERRREGRMVAGVCVGVAEYFGLPVAVVRIGFAVAALPVFLFFGPLVYLVAWAVVPEEGEKESIVEHMFNQQRKS